MIIYIVLEVAMNGLFDINLSIYTYLWCEKYMDNLIYVRYAHIIDIWNKMKYGMNWKWSVFTLIRDKFAFTQNHFLWIVQNLQSIYPTLIHSGDHRIQGKRCQKWKWMKTRLKMNKQVRLQFSSSFSEGEKCGFL